VQHFNNVWKSKLQNPGAPTADSLRVTALDANRLAAGGDKDTPNSRNHHMQDIVGMVAFRPGWW
jgi:hypothetical protein